MCVLGLRWRKRVGAGCDGDAAEMCQPFLFVYMHIYVCVRIYKHTHLHILINTYDLKNILMLIIYFLFPTLSSVPRGLRIMWVCTELCAGAPGSAGAGRGCWGFISPTHAHLYPFCNLGTSGCCLHLSYKASGDREGLSCKIVGRLL